MPPGTVVVKYRELLGPVQANKTVCYPFCPGMTGMAHLDQRGGLYEMYRLRGPVRITYQSAVGTTTNGEILMGIDYDAKDVVTTYAGTAALSPKRVGPVWRNIALSVPPARAMRQKWLYTNNTFTPNWTSAKNLSERNAVLPDDSIAFALQVTSTAAASTGSLWVDYCVEFCSPKLATVNGGMSLVTYSSGDPQGAAYNVRGAGAGLCPVGEGTFYILCSQNMNPTQKDFGTGYTFVRKITADIISDLVEELGMSVSQAFRNGVGAEVRRDESATSNTWCSSATSDYPPIAGSFNGNVLYATAPTLMQLAKVVGIIS